MATLAGQQVPQAIIDRFEPISEDPAAVRQEGIAFATEIAAAAAARGRAEPALLHPQPLPLDARRAGQPRAHLACGAARLDGCTDAGTRHGDQRPGSASGSGRDPLLAQARPAVAAALPGHRDPARQRRSRHRVRQHTGQHPAHRAARSGRAGVHPGRRWSDHPVEQRAPGAGAGGRAVHGLGGGVHRGRRHRRALSARTGLADLVPVGCGAELHRRGRGVLGAPRHRGQVPAGGGPGARVRPQRRAGRHRGAAAVRPRSAALDRPAAGAVYELAIGAAIGAALGFGGAWLLRRGALPAAGLYPLATIAVVCGAYAAGQTLHAIRVPGHLPGRADPRELAAAAPRGHPVVRRGPGLARPDRAVRHARPLRRPDPAAGRAAAPASVSGCWYCCWPGRCR